MKRLLIISFFSFVFLSSFLLTKSKADEENNQNEGNIQTEIPASKQEGVIDDGVIYKNKPMFSFYVGGNFLLADDTTFFSYDPAKIFAPLQVLDYAGYSATLGFIPLNRVSILRYLRGELETIYMRSNYSNIQNVEINPDADPLTQVRGRISLKKSLMYNFYIDLKTFSDRIYPYVGYGFGAGRVDVSRVDVSEVAESPGAVCPTPDDDDNCNGQGLGEDWTSGLENVVLNQFIFGLTYQVPRLNSSFNIEYRYVVSSSFEVMSLNDDMYGQTMDVNYSFQALTLGIKYFFR